MATCAVSSQRDYASDNEDQQPNIAQHKNSGILAALQEQHQKNQGARALAANSEAWVLVNVEQKPGKFTQSPLSQQGRHI